MGRLKWWWWKTLLWSLVQPTSCYKTNNNKKIGIGRVLADVAHPRLAIVQAANNVIGVSLLVDNKVVFFSSIRGDVRFMNEKYLILKWKRSHVMAPEWMKTSCQHWLLCWHRSHGWILAILIKYCNRLLGQWVPCRACQSGSFPQSEKWKHSTSGTRGEKWSMEVQCCLPSLVKYEICFKWNQEPSEGIHWFANCFLHMCDCKHTLARSHTQTHVWTQYNSMCKHKTIQFKWL